jgi:hypothetical protein
VTAGTLREDVEDEGIAIDHPALQFALEVTLLRWRQGMVEDDQVTLPLHDGAAYLFEFAAADEERRIGPGTTTSHHADHVGSGAFHQKLQFREALGERSLTEIELDEHGLLAALRTFEQ